MTTATDQINTFTKTMFACGIVPGNFHKITRLTLDRMVERFKQLRRRGLCLPVHLDHHDDSQPVARADFKRLALSDKRVMGYVSDVRLTPDGKALDVVVRFVRKSGVQIAKVNRLGLSPILANTTLGPDRELIGEMIAMDLCPPADQTQGPFRPVYRFQLSDDGKTLTTITPQATRITTMSEIKMPALNDAQLAVLKRLNATRANMGQIDWWPNALKLLWPDSAKEILGNDYEENAVEETHPEFAALSLEQHNPGLTPSPHTATPAEARKYVDAQAARMNGMLTH
jgi:hypothetical protein